MTDERPPAGARVLFVSGLQIHPPQSGGNLRSLALAGALRQHGFEVHVHSFVGRKRDYLARRPSALESWPDGTAEYVGRGLPGFVAQWGSYALGLPPAWLTAWLTLGGASPRERLLPRRLRAALAACDVVLADFPFVHPVLRVPSARGRVRVLSTHNVEHHLFDGRGRRGRALRALVRRIELRAAASCDVLVSCCDGDRRFFEPHAPGSRPVLVPNGVDLRRFEGLEVHRAPTRRALGVADDVKLFLFTASKWGPNREALDFLVDFARRHGRALAERRVHLLVVGNVTAQPLRLPGFTATGPVDAVEPYFAAADAALNPIFSGAGTNVKMGEFIALRLPILATPFGARGFDVEDGRSAFLFERDGFAPVLWEVRRLFDGGPERLRGVADAAFARNADAVDMRVCVRGLVQALDAALEARRRPAAAGPPRAASAGVPG